LATLDIERQVSGMEQGVVLGREALVLREGVWSDAKQNRKQGVEQVMPGSAGRMLDIVPLASSSMPLEQNEIDGNRDMFRFIVYISYLFRFRRAYQGAGGDLRTIGSKKSVGLQNEENHDVGSGNAR
jgi:hypothetical protein